MKGKVREEGSESRMKSQTGRVGRRCYRKRKWGSKRTAGQGGRIWRRSEKRWRGEWGEESGRLVDCIEGTNFRSHQLLSILSVRRKGSCSCCCQEEGGGGLCEVEGKL